MISILVENAKNGGFKKNIFRLLYKIELTLS